MIYQLRIDLDCMKPPVWRRVEIDSSATFEDLHWVIQVIMNWDNSHLHGFHFRGMGLFGLLGEKVIAPVLEDGLGIGFDNNGLDEKKEVLSKHLSEGTSFKYIYDYGDSWEHTIKVEKVIEGKLLCPKAIKGRMNAPIEDFPPYLEDKEQRKLCCEEMDFTLREYNQMYKGYDPKACDIKAMNTKIQSMFSSKE